MNGVNSFVGFPAATFRFLAELERNNDRDWFNARRDTVEQIAFVAGVRKNLAKGNQA